MMKADTAPRQAAGRCLFLVIGFEKGFGERIFSPEYSQGPAK